MTDKKITLNNDQQHAMSCMIDFIRSNTARVFILKGYAGTGKTTLMKELIAELCRRNEQYHLLASTGRAAKILSNITGESASTIHSMIYKYQDFNQDLGKIADERDKNNGVDKSGQLFLQFALTPINDTPNVHHYYIIDESSMISDMQDKANMQAMFGSGRLLKDLFDFDGNGKFFFVGDVCQLPPVNQTSSPALTKSYIEATFHLETIETELTEVVRQAKGNDIAMSAHKLRQLYVHPQPWQWAKFPLQGYKNIHLLTSQAELFNLYIKDIKEQGYNTSTMIGYSNRQCDQITQIIRPSIGIPDILLSVGDLLLVTQNNYISGLMNGDLVTIEEVGAKYHRAGLEFMFVKVKELYTQKSYSQLMITNIVYSNQTNLSQEQQKELSLDFYYRMKAKGIKQGSHDFNMAMMNDPYFNALRCVYGYAVTCHKSQGGEWDNVYLDIPRFFAKGAKPYVYQWLYTAMTRAKKNLYLVNDFYIM